MAKRHTHIVHDALDPELPSLIRRVKIDAAICNPPYSRPDWRQGFDQVLDEAGLTDAFSSKGDVTAESLFLAQNIRLVGAGGCIGLIVPDGMITGKKTSKLRGLLLKAHRIDSVIQLPNRSFRSTEAHAFIIVLRNKVKARRAIQLLRYDVGTGLSRPITIDRDAAAHRMDYDFFAMERRSTKLTSLSDLACDINRGSINATLARSRGISVFHTCDFDRARNGRIFLRGFSSTENSGDVVAEAGDILVARVDRNLHRKVVLVAGGRARLSDCVYRLRVPTSLRLAVFEALSSDAGASRLMAASRGVGARHLGKEELLHLPIVDVSEI